MANVRRVEGGWQIIIDLSDFAPGTPVFPWRPPDALAISAEGVGRPNPKRPDQAPWAYLDANNQAHAVVPAKDPGPPENTRWYTASWNVGRGAIFDRGLPPGATISLQGWFSAKERFDAPFTIAPEETRGAYLLGFGDTRSREKADVDLFIQSNVTRAVVTLPWPNPPRAYPIGHALPDTFQHAFKVLPPRGAERSWLSRLGQAVGVAMDVWTVVEFGPAGVALVAADRLLL
jgi:hypothetical protein